jgi:hypothetical protein
MIADGLQVGQRVLKCDQVSCTMQCRCQTELEGLLKWLGYLHRDIHTRWQIL